MYFYILLILGGVLCLLNDDWFSFSISETMNRTSPGWYGHEYDRAAFCCGHEVISSVGGLGGWVGVIPNPDQ